MMNEDSSTKQRDRFIYGPRIMLCCALTAATMFWLSFLRWADPVVDFGSELSVAWQLLEGRVLYQDIAYFNGPLSAYFNMLVLQLLGAKAHPILVINLVIFTYTLVILYAILRELSDRISATTASIIFIIIFAFASYSPTGNFNFLCPYAHELTHGLLLSLIAIYFFLSFQKRTSLLHLIFTGIATGLCFLTKPEVFIACFIAVTFGFFWAFNIKRLGLFKKLFAIFLYIVSLLTPFVIFVLFLSKSMPLESAVHGILSPYILLATPELYLQPFYTSLFGLVDFEQNLSSALDITSYYLIIFCFIYASSFFQKLLHDLYVDGLVAILVFIGTIQLFRDSWLNAFLPLPYLLALCLLLNFITLFRRSLDQRQKARKLSQIVFMLFSVSLLAKIFFKVQIYHYGFALALPSVMLATIALLGWLPDNVNRTAMSNRIFRTPFIGLVTALAALHLQAMYQAYEKRVHTYGNELEYFITDERGKVLNEVHKDLKAMIKRKETLAVLPEGALLNYFLKASNPTPYVSTGPIEFLLFGQQSIEDSYKEKAPTYIVLVDHDSSEFGAKNFGVNYGQNLYQWINENYTPVKEYANPPFKDKGFGVIIMKKATDDS